MVTLLIVQYATYHPLLPLLRLPASSSSPHLPLKPCCVVCGPHPPKPDESLSTCSRCKAVSYCGRDHQKQDFADHKQMCRYIQKCNKKREREKMMLPLQRLTDDAGLFWGLLDTRPFMHTLRDSMLAMSAANTHASVTIALDHALECLRLCRMDNLGIRDVVPVLMLQLGQLQECYDFLKWWATTPNEKGYSFFDMSQPFLDTKHADMHEEIPEGFFNYSSVFHSAALAYIKMKLAAQVGEAITLAQALAEVNKSTPPESASTTVDALQVLFDWVFPSAEQRNIQKLQALHKRLTDDANTMYDVAQFRNMHYWPSVMDPRSLSRDFSPGVYILGDRFEVQNWLVPHSLLWAQEPLAAAFIAENQKNV